MPSKAKNSVWRGTNISLDDVVITKRYADLNYLASSGGTGTLGEIRVRSEPANATDYTKTITQFQNGNLNIPSHGFSNASNGLAFKYKTTGSAATNLTDNQVYYIRFVDANYISLHSTKSEATNNNDATRVKITVSGGSGTQTIVDNEYDSSLDGFGTEEFLKVGDLITKTIKGLSENLNDNSKVESEVKAEVIELCAKHPIYKNLRK